MWKLLELRKFPYFCTRIYRKAILEHKTDIRQRILLHARTQFMKYGLRNVSMDDFARDLGMSKKTIYQIFPDKAAIIYAVFKEQCEMEKQVFQHFHTTAKDVLTEWVLILQYTLRTLKAVTPLLIFEAQKYYPEAWSLNRQMEEEFHLPMIQQYIEKGKAEGIFRDNVKPDIAARMRMATIDMMLDDKWFPSHQYDLAAIMEQTSELFLFSLLSEKGREKWEELKLTIDN
jgi:TetR/AcrR family transcriptional regulator, cholesterol catabolism regulator